ncbi:ester cyclase [Nocardia terpenica]|uniref:Ester cyclase n=1 Tax=Nocardia terpenica TaxID=455432 RepID=A0A291RGN0_9NOCA|nr:ester cyclase [Nocardia terpenica]ATL66743.1 ester cyclase [Nocardia terpenica]
MTNPKTIALASFRIIESGDEELAERIIAPEFVNDEADDDPDDTDRQLQGPAGFLATSRWLRSAFSELRFEHEHTLAEGDTVLAVTTMTGTHSGVFNSIQPTGIPIRHKQVHIFALADGRITRHRAVRDDLGLLLQLGWNPTGGHQDPRDHESTPPQ